MRRDSLLRLEDPTDLLSRAACRQLYEAVLGAAVGGGTTRVSLNNRWYGTVEWGRNRVRIASDTRPIDITIRRSIRGATGAVTTNQADRDGLRTAVRLAEAIAGTTFESPDPTEESYRQDPYLHPTLWDDATYQFDTQQRVALVQQLIDPAETSGMLSFGQLRIGARVRGDLGTDGMSLYYPQTTVDCSMTVRDRKGTGSGWAGVNHHTLSLIDPRALAARALDKAQRSVNPVAIEPGRYTTILEPQAVADLMLWVIQNLDRQGAERPAGPFGGVEPGRSKINLPVIDRRLTLSADPTDPDGGFIPYDGNGTPFQAVNWIDRGVLRQLSYDKRYALYQLGQRHGLPNSYCFRLAPAPGVPTLSIDEMIAKTPRGLLVTRFYNVDVINGQSLLSHGYTRDGLWLIEHGTVTKAVKNFRFTESPLFVLNNVLDIGVPVRVYNAYGSAYIAPAIRAMDFNFTSVADAV